MENRNTTHVKKTQNSFNQNNNNPQKSKAMFGIRTKNQQIKNLKKELETAKTQRRIADENFKDCLASAATYTEVITRKSANIEQLCKEGKEKDDEIFALREETKQLQNKLDHYRPMQGPGGKFVKKATETANWNMNLILSLIIMIIVTVSIPEPEEPGEDLIDTTPYEDEVYR